MGFLDAFISIIIPINTVEVYYDLALALYANKSVFKAVMAVSVVFTVVNK